MGEFIFYPDIISGLIFSLHSVVTFPYQCKSHIFHGSLTRVEPEVPQISLTFVVEGHIQL